MSKGRGGYGGFGGGMPNMKQIQQLQKQAMKMQKDMEEATAELEEQTVSAAAGGGAVEVTVSGKKLLRSKLKEVVDPEDVEMLEDLIMAAANGALRKWKNCLIQNVRNHRRSRGTGDYFSDHISRLLETLETGDRSKSASRLAFHIIEMQEAGCRNEALIAAEEH